jgi:SAM-dependent methyltransferase
VARQSGVVTADKGATLGHPSYVWTPGLERRLGLIRRYVPLEGRRILDIGCGVGTFVRRLREFSPSVYGVDIDRERVLQGAVEVPNLALSVGEYLPFADGSFDLVLLHEVLEHVDSDRATLAEAARVLRVGGHICIFCPNRLYPFETHGVFLGKRYFFGNIPLVNWLPDPLRRRLAPHARAYTKRGLRRLYRQLPLRPIVYTVIFPGFDHVIARRGWAGSALRTLLQPLERTPLRIFGLSHFVILEKGSSG